MGGTVEHRQPAEDKEVGKEHLDLPTGKKAVVSANIPQKSKVTDAGPLGSTARSVFAAVAYCSASVLMVLVNKLALSSFQFRSTTALLLFQCGLCVLLVSVLFATGMVQRQRLTWQIVKLWFPVNCIFVSMIWTSFFALRFLSVPMMTVLKNLSNLFTIAGDYFFFGRTYGVGVWSCLFLMALSAVCGAITDLEYNLAGYVWQIVNCLLTSAYSLYLRRTMDKVKEHTEGNQPLSQVMMVYLNNSMSMPLLLLLMAGNGELQHVWDQPALWNPAFQAAAVVSGFTSFAISFASLWCLSTTTPTTYSLLGSLNKIPISLLGMALFTDSNVTNPKNLASVALGLIAGTVFVYSKAKETPSASKPGLAKGAKLGA